MNNKVNYTMIGLLVLFALMLMFGFTYWLLKPSQEVKVKNYAILFDESVLGLNIDSAVKFRGIDVGKVTSLKINPKNTEQVEVLIAILKSTPIKSSTVAKLTSQGITGLSYINLSLGDNYAPQLEIQDGAKYPIIKTIPSFFENFEQSLGSVSTKMSKTLTKTEQLLNDENQKQITILLTKTASFMDKMDKLLDDKTIKNFQETIINVNNTTKKVDAMLPNVDKLIEHTKVWESDISTSLGSIMVSYLGIRSSMAEIKRAVESGEFNVQEIAGDIVPTANNTLLEMQHLMIRVENFMNQYERSPSDILFKQEQIKKGPGEE
ncbi:MAG: MlaD family protein [Campylobacterota bacterium]|nr:MlaD family protein [Campylobacterota bacterium]